MQFHHHAKNGNHQEIKFLADMGINIHLTTIDGENCLHIAALYGHLNLCKTLISDHNFNVHITDNEGFTALHQSACNGSYELVKFFIDKGVDIHLKTITGFNCLHIAACNGHLNLCTKLINEHNFDVHMTDNEGFTALHRSAQNGGYKLIKFFTAEGIDIFHKTKCGMNCLHIASLFGHLNLCKTLINIYNFDIHITNNIGFTALHCSAQNGSYELFKFFVEKGTNILSKTERGMNCLHIAAVSGHLNLCKALISIHDFDIHIPNNVGYTALHCSALNGSYELLKFFVEKGTNIFSKTEKGVNCLHIAAYNGYLDLCKTLMNRHNFDVNMADSKGFTALHFSAENGSYELVKLFADKGTDIHVKTEGGMNCLHIASHHGHLNLCKILINKYEFDLHMADNDGLTSLHYSAKIGSYDLVKFLADKGADIHLKTITGFNCLHLATISGHLNLCRKLINKHNFDVHMTNNEGLTALHCSAHNGSYELFKFFVDNGADIDLETNTGFNCLHIAASNGHLNLCKKLISEHKLDVHMTDNEGFTALHRSAENGSYELVKFFVEKGTNILSKTKRGVNCLHIAALNGHLDLCKALMKEHNFDVNMADHRGLTALHFSATSGSYELVKLFVDKGTDIHLKTENGMNCLHIASHHGHLNLCKILINKYEFDLHMADNDGLTSLHYSAKIGSYDLVKFLADKGADIHLKTITGFNCLHLATISGHLNLCRKLINKHNFDVHMTNNEGLTALHCSAHNGSYELFKFFVDNGADIDLETNTGFNCLHIAASNGHLNLCKKLINEHKFDVHMTDNEGSTALHRSAQNGSYKLITFFTAEGIDIFHKTTCGMNCLHIASLFGHLNLCKTLIDIHNFDIHITNNIGFTALHCSAQNGSYELLMLFVEKGTNILSKTKTGMNCLHIAALNGHLNLCKTLINKHKFDLNMTDSQGLTALHFSIENGSYELVKLIVDKGTDIHLKTEDGMNCLHFASCNGHLNLCKILINKHEFDLHMSDNDGWTSLHYSARNGSYDLVKFFADKGADIHLKTITGFNCLHLAANNGHLNLCRNLIDKYEFNTHVTDNEGFTALHCSAKSGSYELIKLFVDKGTDIHLRTKLGMNCLHIAACNGHLNLCKTLIYKHSFDLHMTDNIGWTPLHFSAQNGSYELVKFFKDMGGDIYLKTNGRKIPSHVASLCGDLKIIKTHTYAYGFDKRIAEKNRCKSLRYFAPNDSFEFNFGLNCLHIAAIHGHLDLCTALVNKCNIDVLMTDNNGWTSLHISAGFGSYELVKFFADKGKDIYLKTSTGLNCLHIAALYGHLSLFETLINKHNFNMLMADNYGCTSLHRSAENGSYEIIKFFVDNGTDIHLKTKNGSNCLHIAALRGHLNLCKRLVNKHNFDVHLADDEGWTAVHYSASHGSYDLFKFLSDKGADISLKTKKEVNCLHIAAFNEHLNLCKTLINKHNFDVHMADNWGFTALHYSARIGNYELVKVFADKGANIFLKTKNGMNCLHIAACNGHLNLCKLLVNKHNFDVFLPDSKGLTALHYSAKYGTYKLVKFLAERMTDIHLKTIIAFAKRNRHTNLCKILDAHVVNADGMAALLYFEQNSTDDYFLYKLADIHIETQSGINCLHIAAFNGHLNLCKTLINEHNFAVHMTDKKGFSALHFSAQHGKYELFKFFADKVADIHAKSKSGMNCLHIAALSGHFNLCEILIKKHNFDVHMTDNYGWTSLHFSAQNGSYELVKYFAGMGIDIHLKAENGMNCLHIAALKGHLDLCKTLVNKHYFDVRMSDNDGSTPLHCSARNGRFELFSYLLEKGSEIYCKTKNMENVLHLSAASGHVDICEYVLEYFNKDYVENSTKNQYSLNGKSYRSQVFYKYSTIFLHARNSDGNTYLHLAANGNHSEVCKLLLKNDTEITNLLNKNDETARDIAKKNGYKDVLNALKAQFDRAGMFYFYFIYAH